jgi:4-amino-4-deoxy-L-arabinose transferase-like glycosyltransferase
MNEKGWMVFFRNEKLFLATLFLSALLIRLVFVLYQYENDVVDTFGDDKAYKHYGEEVLRQGIFVTDLEALGSYAGAVGPGMGWILGIIFLFFGNNWISVFIVNAFVGALVPVAIYFSCKHLVNKKIAAIVSCYSIFYIFFIKYTASAGKDLWMVFLLLITIYLLIKSAEKKRGTIYLFALAIVFVFLIHLDERFMVYSPLLFIVIVSRGQFPVKTRISRALLFAVLVILLMIPWSVRNYRVYERVILISIRTNPFTEKFFGYEQKKYLEDDYRSRWYISPDRIDSIINGQVRTHDCGIEITPGQIEAMKKGKLPRDFTKAEYYRKAVFRLWQPFTPKYGTYCQEGYRFLRWSPRHNVGVILSYSWLLLFLPFGFYYLFRNNRFSFYLLLSILVLHTLLHVLFVPFIDDRYRIPVDPYIIMISFAGLVFLIGKANKKSALLK